MSIDTASSPWQRLPLLSAPALHLPNITEVWRASDLPGLDDYMLRALSLLGRGQYLVLPECQRRAALELLHYLRGLGAVEAGDHQLVFVRARPDTRFVRALLEDLDTIALLRRLPVERLEPFIATETSAALAQLLGLHCDMPAALAERLNHKAEARALLEAAGVRTPGGEHVRRGPHFRRELLEHLEQLFDEGYASCALTRPHAFSGLGIRRVRSLHEAERALTHELHDADELLVEPWLPGVTRSPSAVLYLAPQREASLTIVTTDQLLAELPGGAGPCHFGNELPSRALPVELQRKVMHALWRAGARGIVGVDFIESRGELYATELNARQTGALFGALAARRASGGDPRCIVHNNVAVPAHTTLQGYVRHLSARGLHFDPRTGSGVFVVSQASMRTGKAMVAVVGDASTQPDVLAQLELREGGTTWNDLST